MKNKKILLIGRSSSGKTTLLEHLLYGSSSCKKTQSVERVKNFIDTPGEYIEIPTFYNALIITSYDADVIMLIGEAVEHHSIFPPNFGSAFRKPIIGVITKVDQGGSVDRAREHLQKAGAKDIFIIDYRKPKTLVELENYLSKDLLL
ncbi:MAG: EutP/PduV family microcompartment system protein [Tissierellia bacterium]|nr:EutP/PduV family microcompartment system protein [Tissierellia bacterium]